MIPKDLRAGVLRELHDSHQGIGEELRKSSSASMVAWILIMELEISLPSHLDILSIYVTDKVQEHTQTPQYLPRGSLGEQVRMQL